VSSLRLVLSGVPGMYRAARSRLGALQAERVVVAAALCLVLAAVRAGGRSRTQNALRHFAFSAWLAARYGEDVARLITDEHERHSLAALDSEADQRNNAAGRRYGLRHRDRLASPSTLLDVWRLLGAGRHQWRAGRLWAVRHGGVEPSAVPPQ
jgi:hypothetical protein